MISLDKAFTVLEQITSKINLSSELIAVKDALGATMVEDAASQLDLPPFNKAAMDGYAVLANDNSDSYKLLETVAAGSVPTQKLTPGTTIKIMTGAPIPANTAQIIRLEYADEKDGRIFFHTLEKTTNICKRGEDVKLGETIISAPRLVDPLTIANLIACGITNIKAICRPKVAIIATGNEIVNNIKHCTESKIMNTNGPLLANLCYKNNLDIVSNISVDDDYETTIIAINSALNKADIIILSGGVSVGEFDYVGTAVNDLNLTVHFNQVAVKPGKPLTFAAGDNKLIFGLPGNPVSVYLMFHLFVLRAARMLTGLDAPIKYQQVKLAQSIKRSNIQSTEFKPIKFNANNEAELIQYNGSAHLLALLQCDGWMMIPAGVEKITKGITCKINIIEA